MTARLDRNQVRAVEITGDDAAWLRGQQLPEGCELREVDEVEFWGGTYERTDSGLYVPANDDVVERVVGRYLDEVPEPEPPVGMDLFSGCGGFSLGMHEAGIDVVTAVEWDESATMTYMLNLARPDCELHFASSEDERRWEKGMRRQAKRKNRLPDEWKGTGYRRSAEMEGGCRAFFFGDIRKLSGQQLLDAAGVDEVDVVFGGPPCQGLSTANSKACLEDPRNGLIWEFLRIVAEVRPRSFIIENVPTILTVAKGALFNAIAQLANDAGYNVVATKLNAVEFGVPQYRLRAIIVGTRDGEQGYRYPMPTNWAVGRPIDDKGWAIGHEDNVPTQKRLPPQAHYDPAARRWSFSDEKPALSFAAPGIAPEQIDLLEPFQGHGANE